MRMKLVAVLSLALLLAAGQAMAQTKTTVFGTEHDVAAGNNGCKNCHVTHQASAKGRTLLWSQGFPTTATFGVYDTPTMDSTAVDVGANYTATARPDGEKMYTVLCLSCHDGITASGIISANDGAAIANPTNADGLYNDHPVNMPWPTADAGIDSATNAVLAGVKLYGATNTVQCASCHNAHDNTIPGFLRVANTNSTAGLCAACHK